MAYEYRVAGESDLPMLMSLVEAFANEQQAQMPINALSEQFMEYARVGMAQAVAHPAGCVMIAEEKAGDNAQIVGYAVGMSQEPPVIFEPEPYIFITDLFVAPAHRRKAIATGLVERVRGWGWVKGINRVSLVVPQASSAGGLLTKLGFKPVQTMYYFGNSERD